MVVRQPASPAPFVTSTSTVDSFPVSRALQEREAWSSRLPPYRSCCSAPNQASSVSHLCPKLCSCSALSVLLLCARYSHLHRCCPLGGCPLGGSSSQLTFCRLRPWERRGTPFVRSTYTATGPAAMPRAVLCSGLEVLPTSADCNARLLHYIS